ncbi:MAG: tRNA pseudouridine(38-40) synthase TruA [Bacteroidetes bacterium GWA2_31_9b]|nr:MAG: tRNA pseudouridine(38-40) synthase TruA [Bacteroidetes bacterium GWA2_31_9b]
MRYFIQLSYKGTNYCGWQIQPNGITIQEVITKALSTILNEKIDLTGAGRTDTGVHALYYIAHFDSENTSLHIDNTLIYKLNSFLPKDISIQQIFSVKADANARFDAISRTYLYYIHQQKDPFLEETSWYFPHKLNIDLMNQASDILLLYTDFTSFSKLHTDVKTNNCKIFKSQWTIDNYKLQFEIKADRFLRNMVRAVVGTLIDVGKEKITLDDFIEIIESKNRSNAGISVPAHGLFLASIEYPENIFE